MKIDGICTSLRVIEENLLNIPIVLEEDGVAPAMFNLGSTVTALRELINFILETNYEDEIEGGKND